LISWIQSGPAGAAIPRVGKRPFTHISISDDIKIYSLEAFSLAMALLEIGKTLDAAELKAQGK
jgi:hypothetical protein